MGYQSRKLLRMMQSSKRQIAEATVAVIQLVLGDDRLLDKKKYVKKMVMSSIYEKMTQTSATACQIQMGHFLDRIALILKRKKDLTY